MASTRRLAAILAADVAGYSRLMGMDEDGTHERLKAHFRQLVEPKIEEHQGRVVKNTGDGLLAEFPSVVDAVRCAAEVQRGMIDREPLVSDERRIRFRIGVNLGDVIAEDDDIFGDGVNVAARLEALAEPGGICVSGTVRDQVRDRLPYALDDMGEQSVKNITRHVRVYALRPEAVADLPARSVLFEVPRRRFPVFVAIAATAVALLVIAVSAWWLWPAPRSSSTPTTAVASAPPAMSIAPPVAAPRLSIVVLPFSNLSNDPEQQYFADGVTEDLTTDLSQIADSFVISRNTAFTYRDKPVNAKQIGRELGVRYVLEGSVQRSSKQVRINAQLIDAETDAHLWAERFERDISDLFALQNEITGRIAATLNLELVGAEAARPTEHPDALDYILRGRAAYWKAPSRVSYAEAISLFERALALDPGSVEAQSWLATALVGRVVDGMTDTAAADMTRAEGLIRQALAASPRNLQAHYAKGQLLRTQRRCEEAIPEYEAAIAGNRNWPGAIANLGQCKAFTGSIEEWLPLLEEAIRLSPRDPFIGNRYAGMGIAYLLQSHTDEAIHWLEKARSANPELSFVHAFLASAYGLRGETEHAAAELAEARRLVGDNRFSSISRLSRGYYGVPKVRALYEATYFAGLRKAGMPEE
jgi:TolB-like protein/class 3 adenylate cyclase/Flp pilus assembly protein TadD